MNARVPTGAVCKDTPARSDTTANKPITAARKMPRTAIVLRAGHGVTAAPRSYVLKSGSGAPDSQADRSVLAVALECAYPVVGKGVAGPCRRKVRYLLGLAQDRISRPGAHAKAHAASWSA